MCAGGRDVPRAFDRLAKEREYIASNLMAFVLGRHKRVRLCPWYLPHAPAPCRLLCGHKCASTTTANNTHSRVWCITVVCITPVQFCQTVGRLLLSSSATLSNPAKPNLRKVVNFKRYMMMHLCEKIVCYRR